MSEHKDFLRLQVQEDLESNKYDKIVTRFPPEPNGFPHIGHAKSIYINFGIAKDYQGVCNLRMDDTNPTTEETKYVNALKDAVEWLGFCWDGNVRYTSNYFSQIYEYAIKLIKMGKAYVDSASEEEIRINRGTVKEAGKRSKYAQRTIQENLDLFQRMKNGEFQDGEHILRAKIDMAASNMQLRDPILYRIRHTYHHRTKDEWCIYPMYDFAHCLSDYIEGVTHSFCTLEFENNRAIYDWVLDTLELKPPRPYQYEFARLGINYTVMSKRKLLELVEKKIVNGWDDPRLPTIAGLKRRGYTKESIINFCEGIGIAKANSIVDVAQLEFAIRDDLNKKVPRVMCILDPLEVEIENYEGSQEIEASYYPKDVPKNGTRIMPFSKTIYINKEDFSENPPKGYYRLTPNQSVRLKHAYIITTKEVIKNDQGEVVKIIATYHKNSKSGEDTSGIKVKSAIQWVEASHAKKIEVREYDRLFKNEAPQGIEDINPQSLKIIKNAFIEPAVIDHPIDERFQFEREGYFYADPIDYTKEYPVFNKIVSLKDSWGKKDKKEQPQRRRDTKNSNKTPQKKAQTKESLALMNEAELVIFNRYTTQLKLNKSVANTLARDQKLAQFFEDVLTEYNSPISIANMVVNEVARLFKSDTNQPINLQSKWVAQLVKMIDKEIISAKIGKEVFEEMVTLGENPEKIVQEKGLMQINDPKIIEPIIDEVIKNNPQMLEQFKNGNSKLLGFFVGQVLKATNQKANPKIVNTLVAQKLN